MVSIARKTLFKDPISLGVALSGIIFSVSLISIQVGLFFGFARSTSTIIDHSQADIWVVSNKLRQLDLTLPIPYQRVLDARKQANIDRAEAFIFQEVIWQQGTEPVTPVTVIGFDPDSQLFHPPLRQGELSQLKTRHTAFLNHPAADTLNIETLKTGHARIGQLPVNIVGWTQGIHSLVSSPYLFTSLENGLIYTDSTEKPPIAATETPLQLMPQNNVTAILVRVKPGGNIQRVKSQLNAILPDTRAYTREELSQLTQTYWLDNTGVPFILGLGAVVAIAVGTVIVSQVLYIIVSRHIGEFATLKAMGAGNRKLYLIVMEQALWMALMGYFPGIGICIAVGTWTTQMQGIEISITPPIALGVLGITLGMGTAAASVALRKVTALDPALVFSD